ncbi:MAG TPA: MaoC/PaaZ C-terminal domain-containing protein [Ilumatobacteraceae bacterium]
MPLDPAAVGTTSAPQTVQWDSTRALLYALSVGAGTDDLAYTTENTQGVEQRVLPTFPVVVSTTLAPLDAAGSFDLANLVHGRQAVTLHRALPPAGEAEVVGTIAAMYDKGSAAVVVIDSHATDVADGTPLYSLSTSLFIRGEGGWGGDRGPSGATAAPPDRAPDHVVTDRTTPDQALLYRLNGDRNPLHSDPAFAVRAGFERPILHGLCTFGFTGRALLATFCDGEADRFEHIEGRFASPVLPGDELTVSMWDCGDGEARFVTSVGDRVVFDNGVHRHR